MKKFAIGIMMLLFCFPAQAATRLYAASRLSGETAITMEAGSTRDIVLTFRNGGSKTWKKTGRGFLSLYTTPSRRVSAFRDGSWRNAKQPIVMSEASVAPGKSGTFRLRLHAPEKAGTYQEQFQLAAENVAWVWGSSVRITIAVVPSRVTKNTPVNAKSYIVMDAATGAVLDEKDADAQRSIASMTKLMTVMTAKRLGIDSEKVVAMEREDEVGGGRLRMPYGTLLTVRNLIAAALIGSANNSANALARSTGLSKDMFVDRMNGLAAEMGLAHTRFADPTGIEVENMSTARDVARMGRAAFEDQEIASLTSSLSYSVVALNRPEVHEIKNTDKLLNDPDISVLGGKTGFIYEAGYTLVTKLHKPNKPDVIVVVLGCDTKNRPFQDAKILAEKAWLD